MEKIIHQIWVGPLNMPVQERYFVRDVKQMNPSWKHILWTNENLPELPDNIKVMYDLFGKDKSYAFQADLLRLFIVKEYGGLYLDVDFKPLNSFDDLQDFDEIFCQWNKLILNGVFGASKNNKYLIDACEKVGKHNTWYGPSWFTDVIGPEARRISLEDFENRYAKHHALGSWLV